MSNPNWDRLPPKPFYWVGGETPSNATDARWKQIEDFPNYWVSDDGRVFSMSQKRVRRTYIQPDGIEVVRLFRDKRSGYTRSVNKLVREAFDSKEKQDG